MKLKTIVLLALLLAMHFCAISQTASLQGTLKDSSENKSLQNTVVALLRAKDSSLAKYTRVTEKGQFAINNLDSGKYVVMITHPYFAEYFDNITLTTGQNVNTGIIYMLSKMKLMEEVVVKGNRAMFISGDTTVFTADSFKVSEGANVEELLKKLPGLQVDKNGQITAMGKKVERMLVDGEEFFGDDPGIASKNLKADNVKEVQVYEGKSEQAAFTGIDDGNSKQTINLKLKEDRKRGYFGKVEIGGGLKDKQEGAQDKFNNSVMLNSFKGKRKIAGYGIMSNTGKLNLDWNDQDKYGGGSGNVDISDNGDMNFNWNGNDYNESEGIPTNWNLGIHYSNKFNQDKQSLNGGYRFVKINAPSRVENFSSNYIADSSWKTSDRNDLYSSQIKNAANITVETKLDSMNTIRVMARGNTNDNNSRFNFTSASRRTNDELINSNERSGTTESNSNNVNANVLWMHKFKKLYRTISLNAGIDYSKVKAEDLLYSNLLFFSNGDTLGGRLIDQQTFSNFEARTLNARMAYTEPLMKDTYLEFSYAYNNNRNTNNRDIFAKNNNSGNYDDFVDSLSNNFLYNTVSHSPGLNFRINKKKYNITLGGTAGFSHWEQIDQTLDTKRPYNFINYNPRANIRYNPKQSTRFGFYYNGATSSPSLNDLQPVANNTDPLNIKIGNQNLKPSFNHNFSLYYNSFKMSNERYLYASIYANTTHNAFTQFSEFSDSIRRYYTVNTNGVYNVGTYFGYGLKLKKPGILLGINGSPSVKQNIDFVTDSLQIAHKNVTKTQSYGVGVDIGKDVPDKYSINLSPNAAYNSSVASVNSVANAKYWTYGFNIRGNLKMPKDFELNTDVGASFRQKDPRFPTNNNFTIWNGYLTKKFHKKEFEARVTVYDILDQNRGYQRNFNSYSFTETYRTTLRRLWLISFIWNITKNNASAPVK